MSYTKDRSISFPTICSGRSWLYSTDPDPGFTVNTRVVTATRNLIGERLPNWREIILKGEDATTPLTATLQTLDYKRTPYVHQEWRRTDIPSAKYKKELLAGDLTLTNLVKNTFFEAPTVSTSFVDNMARAAFYKKVHQLTRQFQGLVFLGELEESLHMLRKPALGLQNLAKDYLGRLRKRKSANPKSWTKELGNLWLEQAFGWRPLINDCQDAVKAWSRLTEVQQDKVRVSAGAKKIYDTSNTLSSFERTGGNITNPNSSQLKFDIQRGEKRETVIVRYRGAVATQVEAPLWRDASLFGFNPKEFVPAAWELLPWSFLVDYFTNIGDLLDASVTSVTHTSYVCKSVITDVEKHRVLILDELYKGGVSAAQWYLDSSTGCSPISHHLSYKNVSRTQQSGVSTPSFQFNFDLSDGQLGNCAALLAQANSLSPQNKPRPWRK